mgnify:CR=1 FL=1
MHILEIPSFFPPHGGLFCLEQAKALRGLGHEVRILACTGLGLSVDKSYYFRVPWGFRKTEMEGIEVFEYFQRDFPKLVYFNTKRWIHNDMRMYDRYVRLYGKPDVLHAHCCRFAGIAAMYLSQKHSIPYYITEHLPSELYVKDFGEGWTRHRWLQTLMQRAYEGAACVIPVAEELVDDIAPFFGKNYNYQEISNIIDTAYYAFRSREPLVGRPFRFCCLAVADIHRKGYDVLAEAWRGIENAELHIAGSGTDGDELKRLFDGCHNIYLHGHLEKHHVRELLYSSDALVLPSRSEAQPLVLLEAMATGIPVVSTECVPRSERIAGACLIAETGNAESLRMQMNAVRSITPSPVFSEAVRLLASPHDVALKIEALFAGTRA